MRDIVTGKTRRIIYVAYAIIGLVIGATQVGYSAAEAGQPEWLTIALAVFGFLGTAFGFTASSNTDTEEYDHDDGIGR